MEVCCISHRIYYEQWLSRLQFDNFLRSLLTIFLEQPIDSLADFLVDAHHGWESLTTHRTTITFDFGIATMAIGHQFVQFHVANFLGHGAPQIIVVDVQVSYDSTGMRLKMDEINGYIK